jgi:hypothetical protein
MRVLVRWAREPADGVAGAASGFFLDDEHCRPDET